MRAFTRGLASGTLACVALLAPAAAIGAPAGGGAGGGGGEGGAAPAERAMTPPDEEDGRCGCELDPFGALALAGLVPTLRALRRRRTTSAAKTHVAMLTILAALAALSACSSEAPPIGSRSPAPSGVAARTGRDAVSGAALVLDVRTKEEFDGGHLARALNVPVDDLEATISTVRDAVGGDLSKPVVVYCGSGKRAERAKAILERAGFADVTNAGGYGALKDE